jgi:hypothetical protein
MFFGKAVANFLECVVVKQLDIDHICPEESQLSAALLMPI